MSRPIAISLSPNTTSADVTAALTLMVTPGTWGDPSVIQRTTAEISRRTDGRFTVLTTSGRQALFDILRAKGIGRGDEVILQAFTCIAVPEPILWTGATPIYADIQEGTYTMDVEDMKRKITPRTKAIIVQHTFGIPAPITEIMKVARAHNIFVIEDCAHAFGGTLEGKPLGSFADAAILSFGRDKMLSSVYGGAVVTQHKQLADTILHARSQRRTPPVPWILQQLLHPVVFHTLILPMYENGIGKVLLVGLQKMKLLSKAVEQKEQQGGRPVHIDYGVSPALVALLEVQLASFDAALVRRRAIVKKYIDAFEFRSVKGDPSWLRYPMQVPNPKSIVSAARDQGIMLGDWYDAPLVPGKAFLQNFTYVKGQCPIAEKTAKAVLNLPTYPAMTDEQVEQVISLVQDAL